MEVVRNSQHRGAQEAAINMIKSVFTHVHYFAKQSEQERRSSPIKGTRRMRLVALGEIFYLGKELVRGGLITTPMTSMRSII